MSYFLYINLFNYLDNEPSKDDNAETAVDAVEDDADEVPPTADVIAEVAADVADEARELRSMFVNADIVLSTLELLTNPVAPETIPKAKSL